MNGPWTLGFSSKRAQSYAEAVERLERDAGEALGNERVALMKRWCALLRELSPQHLQTFTAGESDGGWQELNISPYETESHDRNDLVAHAKDHLFYDEGITKEPVTFRQLFLQTRCLEKLLSGFLMHTPTSPEECCLLGQLLCLCLEAGVNDPGVLVSKLADLGKTISQHQGKVGASRGDLAEAVVDALSGMKIDAKLEGLDGTISGLQGELRPLCEDELPESCKNDVNKKECSPGGLSQRLESAKLDWEKTCCLLESVEYRNAVFDEQVIRCGHYEDMLRVFKGQQFLVEDSQRSVEHAMQEAGKQHLERQKMRDRQLHEMNCDVETAAAKVKHLEIQKADLELKLAKVKGQLSSAQARHSELVEDRQVFEEGQMLTLDGLQHQIEEYKHDLKRHDIEARAIEATRGLVDSLKDVLSAHLEAGAACASELYASAETRLFQSGANYSRLLQDQLELLLQQMHFCAAEIAAMEGKEDRITQIGMDSMVEDVDCSRTKMKIKLQEAESCAEDLFVAAAYVCQQLSHYSAMGSAPGGSQSEDELQGPGSSPDMNNRDVPECPQQYEHRIPPQQGAKSIDLVFSGNAERNATTQAISRLFQDISELHSQFLAFERPAGLPERDASRSAGDTRLSSASCDHCDGDEPTLENATPVVRNRSLVSRLGLGDRTLYEKGGRKVLSVSPEGEVDC